MKIKIYVNYYEVIETTIVTISIKKSHLQNENWEVQPAQYLKA